VFRITIVSTGSGVAASGMILLRVGAGLIERLVTLSDVVEAPIQESPKPIKGK
jgi:hypothetical protein